MISSNSTAFLTDMYELTMVDAALKAGTAHRKTVFELFGRRLPATRRFGVVAGTGRFLEALQRFHFSSEQLRWLSDKKIVSAPTIKYLENFEFKGDISGYAEGECYFAGSPILTVKGTFAETVLIETLALSILNHDCAVASAASRMTIAAHGRPCLDMGARRTHERAAVSAARSAVIGGFVGTSDLEAGIRYDIPTIGTSAHAFTLLHDSEADAFRVQVDALGTSTTLLVDTYDISEGVARAVQIARKAGGELGAVRLDSGDLVAQAFKVRGQLDALGATGTKITVTSDLDEYAIAALGAAPVDSYGVGTRLVTGSGVPTAALVYKMVEREDTNGNWIDVAKKSASKSTVGGEKYAGRVLGESGYALEELLVVNCSAAEAKEVLAAHNARPLQISYVSNGVIDPKFVGAEIVQTAAAHHVKARNELPYQAWRLSEGDAAVPTRYLDMQQQSK
ncbi:nicotinate phosphoribosyltransferase [Gleimia sp. 6138-11-ORH1]|uniref:nicotinate phosphoribosyltransferase n=1 Tax=Gleimia sp. 6138-11-ORH1 TaxID=2973937 RepID=UPI002166CCA0|nr:nicotinate phosphoribosyltransferase [Gleimia sp. 6138-11-ORH1]MCS4483892.1 nicotinate phosphoribosyltransferase [Gleimia sp. 6138-11-ORH1]